MAWDFNEININEFNNHIKNSIPLYEYIQDTIINISDFYTGKNGTIVDLGCSTGNILYKLRYNTKNIKLIGYDNSKNMYEFAKERFLEYKNIKIYNEDLLNCDFPIKVDVFISAFTLQFLSLENRNLLLKKIYKNLKVGGIFIVVEKIYNENSEYENMYTQIYKDLKKESFTEKEILEKEKSLRGILIPLDSNSNLEMFKKNGFNTEIFFKNLNFEGYILKKIEKMF